MLMRDLAVTVRVLVMALSRGRMLLRLLMIPIKVELPSRAKKKPARSNTLKYSTAPAYSSNGPPGMAGLPFS
jgi:hypothetical protein